MILFSRKFLNKNRIKKIFFLFLILILIIFNPFILKYFSSDNNLGKSTINYIFTLDSFLLFTILTSYLFFYKKNKFKKVITLLLIINITLLPIFLLYVIEGFIQIYINNIKFSNKSDSIAAHIQTFSKEYIPVPLYKNLKDVYKPLKNNYVNINNQGFRSYDFNQKKNKGEKRIIILGGSTVFGYNVADKNTISNLVEKKYKNQNVKVFNLGMNNFDFEDQINLLSIFFKELNPDIIIFYHGINNLYGVYGQLLKDTQNKTYFKNIDTLNKFEKRILLIKEYLKKKTIYMILFTYYKKHFPYEIDKNFENYNERINYYVNKNYIDLYKKTEKEFCNNIKCFFLLQPNVLHKKNRTFYENLLFNQFLANYPLIDTVYSDFYNKIIKKENENICDLRKIFNKKNENIFFDEVHVNGTGNLIISKEIYNIINNKSKIC